MWFVRFLCRLSSSHAFGTMYVSCIQSCERSTTGQATEFPRGIPSAFCDRSTYVLTVSYTVQTRSVRFTSVTRTLVDSSLSVPCSLRMRSLRLPRRPLPPRRQLPSPDIHFCIVSVRSASVTFIRYYVTAP